MQIQAQTTFPTLIEAIWPQRRLLHNIGLVLLFTLLIALSAQIAIPLPFSPVPITGQTLTVLLTGILLGSRLGAITLVTYLVEGLMGLPVFAQGLSGPGVLVGPTGGYLIGFVAAAAVVGFLAERGWDRRMATTLLAMLTGNLVIYLCGVAWLSYYLGSLSAALAGGLLPFLAGDALKIILAMLALPGSWAFLSRKS